MIPDGVLQTNKHTLEHVALTQCIWQLVMENIAPPKCPFDLDNLE